MSFWDTLPKPFWCLAPMEDVSDTVFRQMVVKLGKPQVMFTEFAHVEAILHGEVSRLKHTDAEKPLVAQIWGTQPQKFFQAAQIISKLDFDGIDINLGCPVKDVTRQGACSALISKDIIKQQQVAEIITAVKDATPLPVSVKTRIGQKTIITTEWISFLLNQDLAAITVHGRTAAEMSKVPVHWDEIALARQLRDEAQVPTLIIGNGDVDDLNQAQQLVATHQVDGIMIGRGALKNPAVFSGKELTRSERMAALVKHIQLHEATWQGSKHFLPLKKFVKAYINGWEGAAAMREQLMATYDLVGLKSKLSELMQ